ncbi:hypothetical protein [Jiangella asiatica]|uniref:TetR family transcriptional regulator n=1 Tax=Jiangella asiatica TaxID=2530372 RepID=A0A4R5DLB9_9ACTN|nr:hypothetical protein [Jiangella asiatica]TDE14217.1 hypothetical protein E1269_03410 [Jiangella asiatica]
MGSEDHDDDGSPMDHGACPGVEAMADPSSDTLCWGRLPLCSLDSLEDLARWRDEIIGVHRHMILGAVAAPDAAGCTCKGDGSLISRLVPLDTLEAWLAAGLDRMRKNGELVLDTNPARLAMALTAALEGGSLLARTSRDIARLEAALDLALSHVRSYSAR